MVKWLLDTVATGRGMLADLKRKRKQQFKCIIILPRPIRWCMIETKMSVYSGLFKLKKMCFTLKIPSKKVMAPMRFFRYLLKLGNSVLFWAFCIFYVHHLLRPKPCVRSPGMAEESPGAGRLVLSWFACLLHKSIRLGEKRSFSKFREVWKEGVAYVSLRWCSSAWRTELGAMDGMSSFLLSPSRLLSVRKQGEARVQGEQQWWQQAHNTALIVNSECTQPSCLPHRWENWGRDLKVNV